ncbi:hypothetical protein B0J13DRAFT_595019, partial [Dactylonectria estremocensis]
DKFPHSPRCGPGLLEFLPLIITIRQSFLESNLDSCSSSILLKTPSDYSLRQPACSETVTPVQNYSTYSRFTYSWPSQLSGFLALVPLKSNRPIGTHPSSRGQSHVRIASALLDPLSFGCQGPTPSSFYKSACKKSEYLLRFVSKHDSSPTIATRVLDQASALARLFLVPSFQVATALKLPGPSCPQNHQSRTDPQTHVVANRISKPVLRL